MCNGLCSGVRGTTVKTTGTFFNTGGRGHVCEICSTAIEPDVASGDIACAAPAPFGHTLTIHQKCAESYAMSQATIIIKDHGRCHVICPKVPGGGGAGPETISNTLAKLLGMDPKGQKKKEWSATDATRRKLLGWANDSDLTKKLLCAACPAKGGCGLTIDVYTAHTSGAYPKTSSTPIPKRVAAAPEANNEVEVEPEGQCVGEKVR
jgi:hypothetical protein